ncbi:MAG: response regulator transcription factor [Anaerolineae bacterium]|nr:response regulator transcription factor [Anaerolineae bacterium]
MSKSKTIVVIDDEATIRDVVRRYLEVEGFRVIEAEDGHQALDVLRDQTVDLILLDIMLPGIDGFSVARALRNAPEYQGLHGNVPIIMLTARGDERDRLEGFELGIDDYIVKPFSPREVVARVKAVLRRSAPDDADSQQPRTYGDLHIDPLRRVVLLRGEPVTLTAKEFDLLWLFARHPQQVLTRDQLIDRVWGHDFYGDESTVTVHIRRLREKIEPNPANPTYIHTLRGVGYKFEPA